MNPTPGAGHSPVIGFDAINWISAEPLPRDREQSHRLHEPEHLNNSIDPITGRDIANRASHPHIEDGNLTVYFESEDTLRVYKDMPVDHPFARLRGAPSDDDDRGG
jgi:hypothetical protein